MTAPKCWAAASSIKWVLSREGRSVSDRSPPKYLVKTLGCKANLYDSQLIEAELQKRGWVPASDADASNAELCIVNSCTVTDEADRQSRKMATRVSKLNPSAKVVFTGCGAEVDPEKLKSAPGVHFVVGNQDKPRLLELVLNALEADIPSDAQGEGGRVLGRVEGYQQMSSRHPMDREWPVPEVSFFTPRPSVEGETGRTRAFLKVQDGCNSFCTYCIIPYGRGPSRSLRIPEIVGQVRQLVEQGTREVVITGVNIGDYGADWAPGPRHAELFAAILAETSIERLRVSSLDPTEITPEITQLMAREPRFCPHFHVSLQSPSAGVLKLMKRKYSVEHVEECLHRIASLPAPVGGVFVGMDLITGFPGETSDEFDETVKALERLPWSRLHVFPYSERTGTPATRLPQVVPQAERVRRARVLRELSMKRLHGIYSEALLACRRQESLLERVLLEGNVTGPDGKKDWLAGYTPNYLRVLVPAYGFSPNEIVSLRPIGVATDAAAGDCSFITEASTRA